MTMTPLVFTFVILVSFVLGLAGGIQVATWVLRTSIRYSPCKDFHKAIKKALHSHWDYHLDCTVKTLLVELCDERTNHHDDC